jgi:hypothetical protein
MIKQPRFVTQSLLGACNGDDANVRARGLLGFMHWCYISENSEAYLLLSGLLVDRFGTIRLRAVYRHLKVIHTMCQLSVSTQNFLLF